MLQWRSALSDLFQTPPALWKSRWCLWRAKHQGGGYPRHLSQVQQPCVFVLSTGRTGTQNLAALLSLAKGVRALHEPRPKLFGLSHKAYHYGNHPAVRETLAEAFIVARQDLILAWAACGAIYVETSPQVTFLAPTIARVCPTAKFIHLVRDPHAVVRSGMRRGWFQGQQADPYRITPLPQDPYYARWDTLTPFEKNAWLWAETNRWIHAFLTSLPPEHGLLVRAEDIFAGNQSTLEKLFAFVGAADVPSEKAIQRVLRKRLNAQKQGDFPPPHDWPPSWHAQFDAIVGETAQLLGYA